VPESSALWRLDGFEYHLDIWIDLEKPEQELINEVLAWVISRADDPFKGSHASLDSTTFGTDVSRARRTAARPSCACTSFSRENAPYAAIRSHIEPTRMIVHRLQPGMKR